MNLIQTLEKEAVEAFGAHATYATKAFLCRAMAKLAHEEGMGLDVASGAIDQIAPPRRSRRPDGDGRITALRGVVGHVVDPHPVELISPTLAVPADTKPPVDFPLAIPPVSPNTRMAEN